MKRTTGQSVILSLLIVLSVVVVPLGGVGTVGAASNLDTFEATNNVDVWDRAALPFRADTGDAYETVTNPSLFVKYEPESTGDLDARKGVAAVYEPGTTITLNLEEGVQGAGTSNLPYSSTQLVVARLEPDSDKQLSDISMPDDVGDATSLLDPEDANKNASFKIITPSDGDVTDGTLTETFTPSKSGVYMFFLAGVDSSPGFSVSNTDSNGFGDLDVSGQTTVIGTDTAVVQKDEANVSPTDTSVVDGNSVDFSVQSPPTGSAVNHTVVLYKEDTWRNSYFHLNVEKEISNDLDESDFELEHSISNVNGVADFNGPVTVLGTTFNDERFAGSFKGGTVVDFVVEQANDNLDGDDLSGIQTEAVGSTTLDASATGLASADGDQTLTVDTFENWSTGTYRWVYVGGGRDNGDIYTSTGTIEIDEEADTGGGDDDDDDADDGDDGDDGDGGDGGAVSPPPDTAPPEERPPGIVPAKVSVSPDGTVSASANASAGDTVQIDIPANTSQAEGVELERLNVSTNKTTSVSVSVSVKRDKPETVPAAGEEEEVSAYINVDADDEDRAIAGSEFVYSVDASRIANPRNKTLYRYNRNKWNALPTTFLNEQNGKYRFRSRSPGFSVFAVRDEPDMPIVDASLSTSSARDGEDVEISATIENRGNVEGRRTVRLRVDGQAVDSQVVVIPAGDSVSVSFTRPFQEGDYEIAVGNQSAGTLSVSAATTTQVTTTAEPTTEQPTTTTSTGFFGPGFGPLAALLAVLLGALLVRRRAEE